MRVARLQSSRELTHDLAKERRAYLFVADGLVEFNGERLGAGDATMLTDEQIIKLRAEQDSELVLFDLAA